MQYLTTLLGDGKPLLQIVLGLAAALLVLLIAVALYRAILGRRVRGAGSGRARQPRLGVVDAYDLDRQRQLVLIRRDNVEHLVMIGGPNDILIESTISRVPVDARAPKDFATTDVTMEVSAPAMTAPTIPVAPAAPSAAPQPVVPPPPPPVPPLAPPVAPPQPVAAPPVAPAAPVPQASAAPAVAPPAGRPGPFVPSPPPQPRPLTPRPLTPSTVSRAGPTLQPRPEPPKPAPAPAAPPAPALKPAPAPVTPPPIAKIEPKVEAKPGLPPRPESKPEPKPEAKPVPAPKEADPLDALEEEMAKLLGRPTDKM